MKETIPTKQGLENQNQQLAQALQENHRHKKQPRPEKSKKIAPLYFLILILLLFCLARQPQIFHDPDQRVALAAQLTNRPSVQDKIGTRYEIGSIEKFVAECEEGSKNATQENIWFCVDSTCVAIGHQDKFTAMPDWNEIYHLLNQEFNSTNQDHQVSWIHNHPVSVQRSVNSSLTTTPSFQDFALHAAIQEIIRSKYDADVTVIAYVVGNNGIYKFTIPNTDDYALIHTETQPITYLPFNFLWFMQFDRLSSFENKDFWLEPIYAEQIAIPPLIAFLDRYGIELEFENSR